MLCERLLRYAPRVAKSPDVAEVPISTAPSPAVTRKGIEKPLAASGACTWGQAAQPPSERAAALLLAAALLAGCAADGATGSSASSPAYEFRLVSETLKDEWASERMFWVDNDRLIFRADVYEGWTRVEGKRYGLYLWDERTRTVRQIEGVAVGLCVSDGVLSFIGVRGDQRVYVEGPLDALREAPIPPGGRDPERLACRSVPPGTVPANLLALLGGGLLEDRRLAPKQALPYRYYPQLSGPPIELPMNPLHTGPHVHRYSEYTRSHIFKSTVFDRASKTTPVLQVFADGTTRTLAIPDGPWLRGVTVPLPTARGWLLATPSNGVYLMRDSEFEHISSGQVRDIAVSSDGCRAALKMRLTGGGAVAPVPIYTLLLCREGGRDG
jgi:hypothetical protein